jgi:prolyl-tRNA synthetase
VLTGRKTEVEKFAGAEYTTSIEALMSDGRALQSGTSHHLGQNFTRSYDITFADRDNARKHPYGTSWGLSTRSIGGVIMCHGDEAGLILPPRIAPIQAVVVPIYRGDEQRATVLSAVKRMAAAVTDARYSDAPVRIHVDDRDEKPGFKFNDWELRGVPLRIEVGPRDLEQGSVVVVDRIARAKVAVPLAEVPVRLPGMLEEFQDRLYKRALDMRASYTVQVTTREELLAAFDSKQALGVGPWCGDRACEAELKDATRGVTIRNLAPETPPTGAPCAFCGKAATAVARWARAY